MNHRTPAEERLAAANAALTIKQLEAENAALRDLLAAISAAADVPLPADPDDSAMRAHYRVSGRRADFITVHAAIRPGDSPGLLHVRAETLRHLAAEPLGYAPTAPPAQDIAGDFGPEQVNQ